MAPNKKDAQNALFRDEHGHGADMAESEGALLWLRVLYGIDLNSYDYPTKTKYDTKALAQRICDNDPYTKFPE